MLGRKKLWVVVAIAAVLLLMLASQGIQRRLILPLSIAQLNSRASASSPQTVVEPTVGPAVLTHHPTPPSNIPPEADVEVVEEDDDDVEEEEQPLEDFQYLTPCGCSESCVSNLKGFTWFSKHYDPNQQPILRAKNNNFDPDAVAWWLGLQRSATDQTLEEVIAKMFQVISPPTVDTRPVPTRCRRCAVVGNSGNLRGSGHGKLIDSHNFILRMNKAVTRGFDKDVGNRTTHHFLYPESAVDVGHGVSLVLLPFKLRDLEWLTSALSTGHIKMCSQVSFYTDENIQTTASTMAMTNLPFIWTYMRVKDRVEADKDKETGQIDWGFVFKLHVVLQSVLPKKRTQRQDPQYKLMYPLGCLPLEVFWACSNETRPQEIPGTPYREILFSLASEHLGIPYTELENVAWVLVVNPVFFKYVHDHWTEHHGRYPSTGMLAIIFALHTCDQVSVFGYGADKQGNWHHYWEENRYAGAFRKTGVHSADFETEVIHTLAKEGKIKLYL